MKYIIDTDILIYFMKNTPKVVERFESEDLENLSTTIINHAELLFGAFNSAKVDQNLLKIRSFLDTIEIVSFDKRASEIFARLKTGLRKKGTPVSDMDLMIAAICISNGSILVTNNTRHFQRIKELQIENWN